MQPSKLTQVVVVIWDFQVHVLQFPGADWISARLLCSRLALLWGFERWLLETRLTS